MTTATAFRRVVQPGATEYGKLYVTIDFDGSRLSMTGVEGPKANGDAKGSCGQCTSALAELVTYADGWDKAAADRLRETWERWHLNDMRAGCEHQRAIPKSDRAILVYTFTLDSKTLQVRGRIEQRAKARLLRGETICYSVAEQALMTLPYEVKKYVYEDEVGPADPGAPEHYERRHSFDADRRIIPPERKTLGWIRQDEHPDGMLSRPCDVCGYAYGSAWLKEDVPADVLAYLSALPESHGLPTAWARE